jgi:hypothetical protein
MKARIKLDQFSESTKGQRYYVLINNEAEYERVKNADLTYEKSKRVTNYLVPASVFERLLALDRSSEKMCGHWTIDEKTNTNGVTCSCCGAKAEYKDGKASLSNFCPECGADMREPEEYAEDDPNKPEVK